MSELNNSWKEWIESFRSSPEHAAEHVKLDFAVSLERRMEHLNMSRADLARKLGTSAAAITKTLSGDANLTIERMVRLAHAVDATLHVHIASNSTRVRWLEVHNGFCSVKHDQIAYAKEWAVQSVGGGVGNGWRSI